MVQTTVSGASVVQRSFYGSLRKNSDVLALRLREDPHGQLEDDGIKRSPTWLQQSAPRGYDPTGFSPVCGSDDLSVSLSRKHHILIIYFIFISAKPELESPAQTLSEPMLTLQCATHRCFCLLLMGFELQCAR